MHFLALPTPTRLVCCLLALAAATAQAQDKKSAADEPRFGGLPTTGKLDPNRVLTERHGASAQQQEPEEKKAPEAKRKDDRRNADQDDDHAPRKRAARPER